MIVRNGFRGWGKSPKRFFLVLIVAVVFVVGAFGSMFLLNLGIGYAGKAESVTIGMEPNQVNSLIYIAENQNYFAANGLNVTVKDYASGLAAVDGLLANEVDVATATEFVIVGKALTNEGVCTFGTIDRFMQICLIGRRDLGIGDVSDLRGKKIGVSLKTASEFYLGRFLDLHGMSIEQVVLVDVQPSRAADMLASGDVDAVIAWQPIVKVIKDHLGNRTVIWPAQSGQVAYCNAICVDDWAAKHPDLVIRFLKSLAQAETYLVRNPSEGKAIVQKRLHYDDAYLASIWPEHRFSLSLDQSLILAMEDEARWKISNSLTSEKETPDFMDYIYLDGLEATKPESVHVAR